MCLTKFSELKALRAKNGISQIELSKKLGIGETSYNKRENGKLDFTLGELRLIKSIFSLTSQQMDDIFFSTELHQKQQAI